MRITSYLCVSFLVLPVIAGAWELDAEGWVAAGGNNTETGYEWGWHRWQGFGSGMNFADSQYSYSTLKQAIDPLNLSHSIIGTHESGLLSQRTNRQYRVLGNSRWSLSALAAPGFRGFSTDDASRLYSIQRRDASMEGGFKVSYDQFFADFSLAARHDLEDAHDGYELEAAIRTPVYLGNWVVAPDVAYTYWNDKRSDYYFGVRDVEAVGGLSTYQVDSTSNWSLGLTGIWSVTPRSSLTMGAKYYFYDKDILNSPLVENGYDWRFFLGWGYDFGGGSGSTKRRR